MNEQDKYAKPLPVDENVVIKLNEHLKMTYNSSAIFDGTQYFYSSTKEIIDKLVKHIFGYLQPQQLLQDGVKAQILEPGKNWKYGKIRLRLVVEFIPDEPEITEPTTINRSESPLLKK